MNYKEMFLALHPGFFEHEGIRTLPETAIATELVMDLHAADELQTPVPCPDNITFGEYDGDMEKVRAAVGKVEENWVKYFNEGDRVYCAYDGEQIVAFCGIGEMGCVQGKRIAGPGCVGTIPAYRKQGIGLEMVRRATLLLKAEGVDIGWIHYTCLVSWYSKIGYKPVLKWNAKGFLDE